MKAYHNENVTLALNFAVSFEDPRKTLTTTPKSKKVTKMWQKSDKNVHVLKRIIEAVTLCAQQGLALWGHREVESEDNEDSRDGSFQAILKSFAKIDPLLKDHLQHEPKDSQMKSWKIQNQIIDCMADYVRKKIIKQI